MERRLPAQYQGWLEQEPALRRMSTTELIAEVQDGPPDRRLAALSLIDLSDVEQAQIEDWIRILPDPEVNELAGAIPALGVHASCDDQLRWVEVTRFGYARRHMPTFLVMLFSALEALERWECPDADKAWRATGAWLSDTYDQLALAGDEDALDDISLFVFENHLDREAVYGTFCDLLGRHGDLARKVSANPWLLLTGLAEQKQRHALQLAESGGGLPLAESWAALHGY